MDAQQTYDVAIERITAGHGLMAEGVKLLNRLEGENVEKAALLGFQMGILAGATGQIARLLDSIEASK